MLIELLKCNRLKPVPVGGFIGILPRKTPGESPKVLHYSLECPFFPKSGGILIPGTRQKKQQQQANKQKQKQNIYLTTRLAAVEHLLQLCQKKIKQTGKVSPFIP